MEGRRSERSDMFLFILRIQNEQYKDMGRHKTNEKDTNCYDGARLSLILQKSSYSLVCSHYDTKRLDVSVRWLAVNCPPTALLLRSNTTGFFIPSVRAKMLYLWKELNICAFIIPHSHIQ